MIQPFQPLRRFLRELRRRNVYKVAVTYAAVAFVGFQAVKLLIPSTTLPPWADELILAFLIVGFPVSLVVAWAFEMTPEGVRRTPYADRAEGSANRAGRWKPVALGAAVVAVLLVSWGTWRLVSNPGEPRSEVSSTAVAVLPFSVEGSPDLEYLGKGMVNLLATKLDGAGELRAVDPRALLEVVEGEEVGSAGPRPAAVARRFGAGLYVVGDVVEVGGRVQLSANLHRVERSDRQPTSEATVSGSIENMLPLVDELAAQLLAGHSGGPAARVKRIAAVTTSSLPALKAFLEGESLFRRGQFDASVAAFQRAVETDSLFALAHYRLSLAAEWNLQDELARAAAERAAQLAGRLSDRDRRMMEAFLVRRSGANVEAEERYRSILGTYPNAMEAWLDLGEVLFHANPLRGRSFTESKKALERVIEFDPDHSTALIHLARIAAFEGDLTQLDSLVRRFMALDPEPERRRELDALQAFAHGDSSRIEKTIQLLEDAEDLGVALAVWATAVYARDLNGAERTARLLAEADRSSEARRLAHAWLAHIKLALGQWSAAREQLAALAGLSEGMALEHRALLCALPFIPSEGCDAAELEAALDRLDPGTIPVSENPSIVFTAHDPLHPLIRFYLLGLTRAQRGDAAGAERSIDSLLRVEVPRTAGSLDEDLARSVRAQVLIMASRESQALAQLEQARMETWYGQTLASPLYSRVFERYVRAELLRSLGRADEALSWYATLAETSPFELPYLAPSHLHQAEIHLRQGRLDHARDHLRRFVELWQDADASLQPQVEKARERLQQLTEAEAGTDE